MSIRQPQCADCKVPCVCEETRAYSADREDMFAVVWKCPKCDWRSLVVSPTGPLIVKPGMCLQCGQEGHGGEKACPSCGSALGEVLSVEDRAKSDDELLAAARREIALGTSRRGLTIVNFVLQRNPKSGEAWSVKGQFLHYVRFLQSLKTVMQEAVRQTQGNS